MTKKHLIYFLCVLFTVSLSSCKSSTQKKEKPVKSRIALTNDSFKVITINQQDVSDYQVSFTLDLKSNRISGNGGCNSFSASFSHNQDGVEIGMAMATKKYCKDTGEIEKQFFRALREVKDYFYDGDTLQFTTEGKEILITAKKKNN